ncbi:MAG: S8 family peptidase, partial [Bacteroidales bacterium]
FSGSVFSQEPLNGKIIVKLKKEYRDVLKNSGNNAWIKVWKDQLADLSYKKKFPQKPEIGEETNEEGQPLVDLSRIYEFTFEQNTNLEFARELLYRSGYFDYVEFIYPPELLKGKIYPSDPQIADQYYLNNINAYRAWGIETGDSSLIIGLSDTGTDTDHPDLINKIAYNYNDTIDGIDNDNDGYVDNFRGWDLAEGNNNTNVNKLGHGVHISGLLGAEADNNEGIAGLAHNIPFLPVKIDDEYGKLTMSYESIVYAADQGCSVINCSWGGLIGAGAYGQDIINYATYNKDALVVAAAGNSNSDEKYFPAGYNNVISVAATNNKDYKWAGSTYHHSVDLAAPGESVRSTWNNSNYVNMSGTSTASPMVAATAGLVRSQFPNLNALQAGEQIRSSTRNVYQNPVMTQFNDKLGTGILDMYQAVKDISNSVVRFSDINWSHQNINPGVYDTILISGKFKNYLNETPLNSKVILRCEHPSVFIVDSAFSIGALKEMSSTSNANNPFRAVILPGMPISEEVNFKLVYKYNGHKDYQYIQQVVNRGYFTLNTGDFKVTLNSSSRMGYNDDKYKQGIGLLHKNMNESMLTTGGLLVGTAPAKVSDVVYGEQGFDNDFSVSQAIRKKDTTTQPYYENQYQSVFDDANLGNLSTGLSVTQNVLEWSSAQDDGYMILEYIITNKTGSIIDDIYTGYYADWDIHHSHKDRCEWNKATNLSYVYDTDGYGVGGMKLLNASEPVNHYAFDNNGDDNSIELDDGFAGYEKWQAMQNTRDKAGFSLSHGNNVSHLLSSGPYDLAAGDSLVVAYAILAGNNLADIEKAAERAAYQYHNVSDVEENQKNNHISVYPNPAKTFFTVKTNHYDVWNYEIYNMQGGVVSEGFFKGDTFTHNVEIEPGIYLIKVNNEKKSYLTKIMFY